MHTELKFGLNILLVFATPRLLSKRVRSVNPNTASPLRFNSAYNKQSPTTAFRRTVGLFLFGRHFNSPIPRPCTLALGLQS
jgi:hypothetical protein